MTFRRLLAPTLLCAALAAGEAPPVVVTIADGDKLTKDWEASIYAKVWNDPSAAKLREMYAEAMKSASEQLGFDPMSVVSGMRGARLEFLGMAGHEQPIVTASVDLGAAAQAVMAQITTKQSAAATVPGADEAVGDDKGTIARFGTILAAAMGVVPVKPAVRPPADADIAIDLDAQRLVAALRDVLPPEKQAEFDTAVANLKPYLGMWNYRGDLVPEGFRDRLTSSVQVPGTLPVDRALLARLPASTLLMIAAGFDGTASWKAQRQDLLLAIDNAMHLGTPVGVDQTESEVNALLQGMGLKADLATIVQGLTGTFVLAVSQGAPFPGITIILPRSAATDELVQLGMGQLGASAPTEGQSGLVPVPNLPIPVTLVCDKGWWVATTDAMLSGSFTGGQPGGFADSPAAKALYAAAPASAYIVGVSDTPNVLRTVHSYLGMALGMNPDMDVEQKNAILSAILRFSSMASTGYLFASTDATGSRIETRGILGLGALPLIGGAVALSQSGDEVPFAIEQDDQGMAEPAIDILASQVFPAQIQYQGSAFSDLDGDGLGEYGLLADLQAKELLGKELLEGWQFSVFLPDAAQGGTASEHQKGAADAAEKAFIGYAWPNEGGEGKRMFAIDATGVVYQAPATGAAPAWNALYDGQGWDAAPAWPPAQR
jgi:hypothetical protein